MNPYKYYPQRIPLKWFNIHNGLESGQVHNITQDEKGLIWLSGPNGLSRYNGNVIENFTKQLKLSTHGLRWVEVGSNDQLFAVTDINIDLIEKGISQPLSENWQYGHVNQIFFNDSIGLLIASSSGIFIYKNKIINKMLSGNFDRVFVDQKGQIWTYENRSALKIYSKDFSTEIKTDFEMIDSVTYISEGIDGTVNILTENHLYEIKDLKVIRKSYFKLISAVIAHDDELWVGFNNQLIKYSIFDNKWSNPQIISKDCYINSFFIDNFNNIWGATDQHGAIKVSALKELVFQPKFESEGSVFSINKIDDDRYSVAGRNINKEMRIDKIYYFKDNAHLDVGHVWDQIYLNEHFSIVVSDNGVFKVINGEIKKIFKDDKYLSKHGRIILKVDDILWIGTRLGLTKLRIYEENNLEIIQSIDLGYVYCLDKDKNNNLWVGTLNNGLWIEQKNDFIKHNLRFLSENSSIYCIRINDDNCSVILHNNLISVHHNDGHSQLISETQSLVSGWSVVWDNDTIWVGGSNGLTQYDIKSKEEIRNITALLSKPNWEFTTSKSLLLIDHRYLLCGLNSGLAIVDKNILSKINRKLNVYLDHVKWENTNVNVKNKMDIVKLGNWTLKVNFFSAWYYSEHSLKYRYKLLGFDNKWNETQLNQIHYNSLPIGHYKLFMKAFSPLTGWSESIIIYEFEVDVPMWARGWLAVLYNIKEVMYGVFSNKKKNSNLAQMNEFLEEKLQKNNEEITKTYIEIQKANTILKKEANVDELTGIANRRSYNSIIDKELEVSIRSNTILSLLMIDIDDFKVFNDTYGHELGDLVLIKLAETLKKNIRKGDLACRYGGEEFAVILPHTSLTGAKEIAKKLVLEVSKIKMKDIEPGVTKKLTISIGIGVFNESSYDKLNATKLMKQADEGLYLAKHKGKNQFATIAQE